MTWTVQQYLKESRSRHSCGALRLDNSLSVAVVAGGDKNGFSVETLLVEFEPEDGNNAVHFAEKWDFGPNLPELVSDAASATTPDQKALLVIGGTTKDGNSRMVLKLQCMLEQDLDLDCSWTKLDYELKAPSSLGLVLTIPQVPMVPREFTNAIDCANRKAKHPHIFMY